MKINTRNFFEILALRYKLKSAKIFSEKLIIN